MKNIVLVHGASFDGSGWKPVYEILVKDGYHLSVVQEALTSLERRRRGNQARRCLQPGPCILVIHSYGGTVATEGRNRPARRGVMRLRRG